MGIELNPYNHQLLQAANIIMLTSFWSFYYYAMELEFGFFPNCGKHTAKPSWYMSHYTVIYKNGERMRDFLGFLFLL